jgi:hypothetical protein
MLFARVIGALATTAVLIALSPATMATNDGERQTVSVGTGQFAVVEADSATAERLEKSYPSRLRRLLTANSRIELNNVTVAFQPRPVAPGAPPPVPNKTTERDRKSCGAESPGGKPNDRFLVVCVDELSALSERDRRALRGFIDYAKKEALPLLAHVASEREMAVLESVLADSSGPTSGVRFREVRYGDGLAAGQIRVERIAR